MSESMFKMKEYIFLTLLWISLASGYENLCNLGTTDPNECCKLGYNEPFSHPSCFKYYTCLDDRAIEEECPEDAMYKNGTCIPIDTKCMFQKYADEIKRSCRKGEVDAEICCQSMPKYSITTFKNPKNCRKFYTCFYHKLRSMKCPFRWEFSVRYGVCMFPKYAKCTLGEESGSKESTEAIENGSEENTTNEESTESSSQVSRDCLWGKVPAEECCKGVQYWQDVLLKNPEDCTTYIQCVHEIPTLRFCPSGLHWNPEANICDWPSNAKCNSMEVTTISHQDLTTKLPSDPSEESKENACLWGKIPAQDCCIGVPYWQNFLLKNPENCGTYIQCVNEEPVVRYCPRGLHWSPKTQCCDWPEAANCQINASEEVTEENPESTTVTEEETGTISGTSTSHENSSETNIPEVTSITSEMSSSEGETDPSVTPEVEPNVTTEGSGSGKENMTSIDPETTSNLGEIISTEQGSTLYDGEITSKSPMVTEETTEDLSTIRSTGKTEENTEASEHLSSTTSSENAEETTGTPEVFSTTEDTGNSEVISTTMASVNTEEIYTTRDTGNGEEITGTPEDLPITTSPGNTVDTSGTVEDLPTITGNPEENPETTTQVSSTEGPAAAPCEDCLWGRTPAEECCLGIPFDVDLLLRNPEDCNTYIQCVHEKPMIRNCPAGLHWNVKANYCDWPANANCINDEATTPKEEETSNGLENTETTSESLQTTTVANGNTEETSRISEELSTTMGTGNDEGTTGTPEDLPITTIPGNTENTSGTVEDLPTSTENPEENPETSTQVSSTEGQTAVPCEDCLWGRIPAEECCLGVPFDEDLLLRNPEDCNTYIQCVHEKPMIRNCPAGLHWNVKANYCDWPANANCINDEATTPKEQEETSNGLINSETTAESLQTTSNLDLSTESNTTKEQEDTSNGLEITESINPTTDRDVTLTTPSYWETEDCIFGRASPNECCSGVPYDVDVLLMNPFNCTTYYQCVHEVAMERQCPYGLHWNALARYCDWPALANCSEELL